MIKLCYKEYPFKMSLAAIKQFKQATGKDLWFTLISFIEAYTESSKMPIMERMKHLYSIIDFESASELFHALIKAEDKSIPLSEIQDAMFRVGWLPSVEDDDLSNPWPIVMVSTAYLVDKQFADMVTEKKPVTSAA